MSSKLNIGCRAMLARCRRHRILLAIGAILPLTLFDSVAWADCTPSGPTYVCTGTTTSTQSLTVNNTFSLGDLAVTSDASFEANLTGAQVLNLKNKYSNTSLDLVAGSNLNTTAAVLVSSNSAGTTTMTVGGNLTSSGRAGIRIEAKEGSTGVHFIQPDTSTISTTAVAQGFNAIVINQAGSGASHLETDGTVNSENGNSIKLDLSGDTGDAIIKQGESSRISARQYGIQVDQKGAPGSAIDVDVAGQIQSSYLDSVHLENDTNSGNITFRQQANSSIDQTGDGQGYGVALQNRASGPATSAIISGKITSSGLAGVRADMLNAAGGNIDILQNNGSVIDSSSSSYSANGITTVNKGAGNTAIIANGRVSGAYNGIYANNYNSNVPDFYGSGDISITTSSDVSGGGNVGVLGLLYQESADPVSATLSIVQTAGTITGAMSGIETKNLGSGQTVIDVSGSVTGGSRAGIFTEAAPASTVFINVKGGANVSATSGIAIQDHDGDANATLESGATVTGKILLQAGSDALDVARNFNMSDITGMDGGDDVSDADGMIDTLTFNGGPRTVAGATLLNWENVVVDNGTLRFTDNALTTGSEAGLGFSIRNGGIADVGADFALTGNMAIGAGSRFAASGGGSGVYSVSGNLNNAGGALFLRDGSAGDEMTIQGDYAGGSGSVVYLDTVLGDDASATDRLVIEGNASGAPTVVHVTNVGGAGDLATDGIALVKVAGEAGNSALNDAFALASSPLVAGKYEYRLSAVDVGTDKLFVLTSTQRAGGGSATAIPMLPLPLLLALAAAVGLLGRRRLRSGV